MNLFIKGHDVGKEKKSAFKLEIVTQLKGNIMDIGT